MRTLLFVSLVLALFALFLVSYASEASVDSAEDVESVVEVDEAELGTPAFLLQTLENPVFALVPLPIPSF
jgi:hypothetical protein